jgi:putative transposase
MDFVHDQLATGRKLRVLTIVDTWSRFSPAVDPRSATGLGMLSRRSSESAPESGSPRRSALTRAASSSPATSTSGPTCMAWRSTFPDRATDNAFIEAFNGKLRQECLSVNWFPTLGDAREKMEAWRMCYNEERPHSAIGYKFRSH